MKNLSKIVLVIGLLLIGFVSKVSALELDNNTTINNKGVIIEDKYYDNLVNLGFTNNEILNMTQTEFDENKNLIGNVVSTNDKYYKVVINYDNNNNFVSTKTEEINEQTYNSGNMITNPINQRSSNGYTETSYKKMTTQIILLSFGYRFKNTVEWKNIPSTRSYDIIGIGIDNSVYISSDIVFQQNYCYSSGSCSSSNVSVIKNSTTGGAALFNLPTSSSITSMNSYIYFMVGKTSNNTLNSMYAYGDYAHAVKNTSSSNSSYYTINKTGLSLYSSIVDKYDEIPVAKATWTGTW